MKRLALTFALLLGLAAPAWAGFAEGYAAYKRGDYATALRELRPFRFALRFHLHYVKTISSSDTPHTG